jgi:hypothetical protein
VLACARGRTMLDRLLQLAKVLLGNSWNRAAFVLIAGGVLAINGVSQFLIPPTAMAFGISIAIPDTPVWVAFALIGCGVGLFVLGRIVPDRNGLSDHDRKLVASLREILSDQNLLNELKVKTGGKPSTLGPPTVHPFLPSIEAFLKQADDIRFDDIHLQFLFSTIIEDMETLRGRIYQTNQREVPVRITSLSPIRWIARKWNANTGDAFRGFLPPPELFKVRRFLALANRKAGLDASLTSYVS